MALRIFNTVTNQKEEFQPVQPGKVGMYVCGITAYDRCHLGHARGAVVFDVVRRYLESCGYHVLYVRNFTDVDDKIIDRAAQRGVGVEELSDEMISLYYRDMDGLGVRDADLTPRATQYVKEMVQIVQGLLDRGFAYTADGDVFYDISKFAHYGRLSRKKIDELEAGARVEVDVRKRNALDFALWKAAKPGEPSWESPWGRGRPGWHIECSTMSSVLLGPTFDIHGGGRDLIFPHHENEIAQSEGFYGQPFARYWMHNGFVTVDDEKMSKSTGKFFTVEEILRRHPAEAVRHFLLCTHYRSPMAFSYDQLESSRRALDRFYQMKERLEGLSEGVEAEGEETAEEEWGEAARGLAQNVRFLRNGFHEAMEDDFNTALALGHIFALVREVNVFIHEWEGGATPDGRRALAAAREAFEQGGEVLGLFQNPAKQWLQAMKPSHEAVGTGEEAARGVIEAKIVQRAEARRAKNWGLADAIREELRDLEVILEDTAQGTTWRLAR